MFFPPKKREFTTDHIIRALNDETYNQNILSGDKLKRIIGHLPKWITYPDAERVGWLNRAVRVMWPFLNRAISNSVVSSVEPILNKLVEGANVKMKFSKFTLGLDPIVLVSVKAVTEVPNEVGLDIEGKWAATDPEVQLDVSFMGLVLPIAIEKVEFFGCVRIVFGPLCDWWPTFSAMQVAFIGKPTINFNLRLVGGDITAFPFVEKLLTNLIKNVLVNLMVWPNRLDIGITNDEGAPSVSNSGIIRITVKRAANLPNMDLMKSAAKMRPAIELVIRDGDYDKPKIVRATQAGEGEDPEFQQTFDVRVHDIRGSTVEFCVVDTGTLYRNAKKRMGNEYKWLTGKGKKRAMEEDENRVEKMSKSDASLQQSTEYDGEKKLNKTTQSTLGVAQFEIGQLVDKPNEEISETIQLNAPKGVGAKVTKLFGSSKKDAKGNSVIPEISFTAKYMPFALEVEDEDEKEKMKGVTLEDVLRDGVLEQFCGVLHVKLLRAAHLSAKDVNGRSDPFVKLSMGGQLHKSSTKRETLNPVWDEHYDFVVGVAELENNQKLRAEVWDWDRDGKREFMGHVTLDVKRVIGQIMLLAGQASRVLKLEEELEETSSGRLHMEIEFYSVADNAAKVNEAIEARAEAEVALEHAAKNDESTPSKNEVRDRKMEMMASMSRSRNAPAEHLANGGEDAQDSPGPGGTPISISMRRSAPLSPAVENAAAEIADLAAMLQKDAPESPEGGGGCFGGCFGGSAKKKTRAKPPPPAGADSLPAIEAASPSPRASTPRVVGDGEQGDDTKAKST